jgi:hypothetical protein
MRFNNSGITSRRVIETEHIAGIRITATAYKGRKISRKAAHERFGSERKLLMRQNWI